MLYISLSERLLDPRLQIYFQKTFDLVCIQYFNESSGNNISQQKKSLQLVNIKSVLQHHKRKKIIKGGHAKVLIIKGQLFSSNISIIW